MASVPYLTVVETPSFLRDAKKLMGDNEREALVGYLSSSPNAGRLMKKANISQAERNELKQLADLLVEQYDIRGKKHGRKTHR